jgi:class 3 adenylate cyclase
VHVGEVVMTGGKAGGVAVNIGARIAALAGPSEVLVSRIVKDLVAGSRLIFTSRGTRQLKGIEGSWDVYSAEGNRSRK